MQRPALERGQLQTLLEHEYKVDYITLLAERLGRDAQQELRELRTRAQASVRIDQLQDMTCLRRQRTHHLPTRA